MTPTDLSIVLAAIKTLSERTGTEICVTSNEKVLDGSRVMLKSPEGWFIDVVGGPLQPECEYPSLGLSLRGYIHNPKRDILEALTLHPIVTRNTVVELDILDQKFDFAGWVVEKLVPNIRDGAAKVHAEWAAEASRLARIVQLKAHFEMDDMTKKFNIGAHTKVEISVRPSHSDAYPISMGLRAEGLSVEQLESILKVLNQAPPVAAVA